MSSSKTIGIIGGGQLGQMMAISAIYMGHKGYRAGSCGWLPSLSRGGNHRGTLQRCGRSPSVGRALRCLTYEFENVDADGLDAVIKDGQLPQGNRPASHLPKSHFWKDFLSNKAQVTVAPTRLLTSSQDLADIDLSKTMSSRLRPVATMDMVRKSFAQNGTLEEAYTLSGLSRLRFRKDSSTLTLKFLSSCLVMAGRDSLPSSGKYPPLNNILSKTIVPARISESLAEKAKAMAVRIAEQRNLSGTLCVEMFATADDIIVNEIAPRPHNSGHYSIGSLRLLPVWYPSWVFSDFTPCNQPPCASCHAQCSRPTTSGCWNICDRKSKRHLPYMVNWSKAQPQDGACDFV